MSSRGKTAVSVDAGWVRIVGGVYGLELCGGARWVPSALFDQAGERETHRRTRR